MFQRKLYYIILLLLVSCPYFMIASDIEGVFAYKVGNYEVFMLVEGEGEGTTSILIDLDNETMKDYIPKAGFNRSTNAFLVMTPIQNILVDTGTGSDGIILEKLKLLGVEPPDIDTILLTHLHFDHFGGLVKDGKPNYPNAKIFLALEEFRYFTAGEGKNQSVLDIFAQYGDNIDTFLASDYESNNKELFPGIIPIALHGHTPGHTAFLVENEEEKLIIAGDFLHVALVQFPNPDISATYDNDTKAAANARRNIIEYAVKNEIPIGGMHLVYPGIGKVNLEGNGFRYTPIK